MSPGPAGIGPVCPGCTYPVSAGCRCGQPDLLDCDAETPAGWRWCDCGELEHSCECPVMWSPLTIYIAHTSDGCRWGIPSASREGALASAREQLAAPSRLDDRAGGWAIQPVAAGDLEVLVVELPATTDAVQLAALLGGCGDLRAAEELLAALRGGGQ